MNPRLAQATSPYLRQHAGNPVDWYPWGDEAFARARAEDKPILLSVGYSACHWCHVMAHESFEDAAVAAVMNREFVNVKVDREERPDVDQVYQSAHALMSRRGGGWPLTAFCTPQGDPFFIGTYFPPRARHGLPAFVDLLARVALVWREQRDAIGTQGAALRSALAGLEPRKESDDPWPPGLPRRLLADLRASFDAEHGGFGSAPKFPHVPDLAFALRASVTLDAPEGFAIAATTLQKMVDGGIHDQLGGGFCRYSVDERWQIPHFEKMLYDNGPLLGLLADLALVASPSEATRFVAAAEGVVEWLQREMVAPDGAFYASLDADSAGEEGRYYVWEAAEVRVLLTADELAVVAPHYGLDGPPNFEGRAWNLAVARPLADVAERADIPLVTAKARLATARSKLLAARERRVRPARDDKLLTSWNALAIAGVLRAARNLARPEWTALALRALDAQVGAAWRDGRLFATRGTGAAQLAAYLDDHAFLLVALEEALQTRFRPGDYAFARMLAEALLERFEDAVDGGFWFTSHDHEALIHRHKPGHDQATPSGNGMAALGLAALGHLCGERRYVAAAERAVALFAPQMAAAPRGFATMMAALEAIERPPASVLLVGAPAATAAWHARLIAQARPDVQVYDVGDTVLPAELRRGAPVARGSAAAWLCDATRCLPPIVTPAALEAELDADFPAAQRFSDG